MSGQLYFVPMIARALQETDPAAALRRALEEIRRLGSQPEYAQGYQQFLRFMKEISSRGESALRAGEEVIPDVLAALLVERADQALESDPESYQTSAEPDQSRWQEQYEELWAAICGSMDRPPICEILIERDDAPVATCVFEPDRKTQSVGGIVPGDYRLVLETGRTLWEGRLEERDLVWSKAFPAQPLKMAADTGEAGRKPTRHFTLLGGDLVVRVHPGIETGSLGIEQRSPEVRA